jgi:hypothetical protein
VAWIGQQITTHLELCSFFLFFSHFSTLFVD